MDEIRFRNYQEFLAYWKDRTDLDHTDPFFQAMLETIEDAAAKEQTGQHVDPGTIFDTSVKKAQVFARAVPEARP